MDKDQYDKAYKEMISRMLNHRLNTGKLLAQQCSALLEKINGVKTTWETIYNEAARSASETE